MKKGILLALLILVVGIPLTSIGTYIGKKVQIQKDEQRRQQLYSKILDGISVKPTDVTIDFSKQISTGSPLIFGGAQYPDPQTDQAWDAIQSAGVTAMRTDFYIENMVPYNTTVDDYKNNKNNIKDSNTWNGDFIQGRLMAYKNAKKRGMKTMGIVSYAPAWLTYSHTTRGVPMDWGVYEDIVKKSYLLYRDNLDYLEIWNEPTFSQVFLDVKGSNLTPTQAYAQIFYHAAKAIREVDTEKNDGKKILIGGPVSDNPNDTSMLEAILQDSGTKKYLDFISYHNYSIEEPSWNAHKDIMSQYGVGNLPIFITEWNYNPKENEDSPYKTSNPAIIFTANQFLEFLKMGLAGANYYSLLPISANKQYLGFYKNNIDSVSLLPQARSWTLLSKDMGLGAGKSKIYDSQDQVDGLTILGFTNSLEQQGIVILNTGSTSTSVNLHLKNLNKKSYAKLLVYYGSGDSDAKQPAYEGLIQEKNNSSIDVAFSIPKEAILGVLLGDEKGWYNLLSLSR